jgi:translation initiation factor IF-2
VKEVRQGLECGIRLDNFLDFQEGDLIQAYDIEYKKATL